MDSIRIVGGTPLRGSVPISGAKNAALPILAAALLADGHHVFRNVPDLRDIHTMAGLLNHLGLETAVQPPRLEVIGTRAASLEAPYELVKKMRASVLVLGPLVARYGEARVSLPGGCAIGARPIDQHLKGLEAMGAVIELHDGYVHVKVPAKRLKGAEVVFDMPTVTGTENLMMAAALADGRTTFVNAAREPEVEELARVLNKMGARIEGAGTATIVVEGREQLAPVDHAIIPDRIEAGHVHGGGRGDGRRSHVAGCHARLAGGGRGQDASGRSHHRSRRPRCHGGRHPAVSPRQRDHSAIPGISHGHASAVPGHECAWLREPARSPKPSLKTGSCTCLSCREWEPTCR